MLKQHNNLKPNFVIEDGKIYYRLRNQRYRAKWCKCAKCKKVFPKVLTSIKTSEVYCSKKCANLINNVKNGLKKRGSNNYRWKGGRKKDGSGYVRIYMPNHPNKDAHSCVLEHRYKMEQHIGRYLEKDETVHHKNGIRDDNRIENLELRCGYHPQGQTPEDMVEWANIILKRYSFNKDLIPPLTNNI